MHYLPVVWRLATSALLLLLHTGHHVTRAQNNFGNMTEVNRTLVLERTVTVNPTSVKYGETVTIKCNLKVMVGLSNSVYHLWLYQKSLPVRMAAFHPQSTNEEGYPRELVAHPNGIRCYESNPKSESTRITRTLSVPPASLHTITLLYAHTSTDSTLSFHSIFGATLNFSEVNLSPFCSLVQSSLLTVKTQT